MGTTKNNLPANYTPSGEICIPVTIPNDPEWLQVLLHAISIPSLQRYWKYSPDGGMDTVRKHWESTVLLPLYDRVLNGETCAGEFFTGEAGCLTYPLYAPFINYIPINPYNEPDTIPDGYADKPFYVYGLNGGSPPIGYQNGDVIVPFGAIDANPFDLFTGNLVSIKITVTGSGQIELDLLNVVLGGVAVIGINNPPNLADLLLNVFSPDETTIDLELDVTSVPQELDITHEHEIDIVAGAGIQTDVWITFFPVVDDSIIPVRFGGGIRSIQLCGFEESAEDMGITDIRFTGSTLEYFINGSWIAVDSVIKDCNDVENCLTSSSTIAGIQSQITANDSDITALQSVDSSLQSQITANDSDISALQSVDSSLQLQITANDSDITALQSVDSSLQLQITANDSDITALQSSDVTLQSNIDNNTALIGTNASSISSLQSQINSNDTELIDHESRITVLESAGAGAGAGAGDYTAIEKTTTLNDLSQIDIAIPDGYDSIRIILHAVVDSGTNPPLYMKFNDDTNNGNYDSTILADSGQIGNMPAIAAHDEPIFGIYDIMIYNYRHAEYKQSIISASWILTSNATQTIVHSSHMYESNDPITKVNFTTSGAIQFKQGTHYELYAIGTKEDVPDVLITFDAGGDSYTISDNGGNMTAIVTTGGNGGNCVYGNGAIFNNDWIAVSHDLGSVQTIDWIDWDFYYTTVDSVGMDFEIWIDGVMVRASFSSGLWSQGTWLTFSDNPAPSDYLDPSTWSNNTGQVIEIRMLRAGTSGGTANFRMDNIKIGLV